jgi:hypothetical protein
MWAGAAVLLALPFIAMWFTAEVNWSASDFIIMGALLAGSCGTVEIAARRGRSAAYKLAVISAVVGGLLIIWANLAVGHEHGPHHLLLYAALLVGVVGSAIARFGAKGMTVAMLSTAAALVVALRLAMLNDADPEGSNLLVTSVASAAIASPFLMAAWLFRRAART